MLCAKVQKLCAKDDVEQHSDEWYEKRKGMVTASDFPTVLNENPYKTRRALLKQKLGYKAYQFSGNAATEYGNRMEDVAAEVYAKRYNTHLLWFGLVTHDEIPWFGGSPDRVTPDGILLEIKCPFRRQIKDEVPGHYMAQIQGLMHILDLNLCHFVQFRPETDWTPEEFSVVCVQRDEAWLPLSMPKFKDFRDEWMKMKDLPRDEDEGEEGVIKISLGSKPRPQKEREVYKFFYPYPLLNAPGEHLKHRRYDSKTITCATGGDDEFFSLM